MEDRPETYNASVMIGSVKSISRCGFVVAALAAAAMSSMARAEEAKREPAASHPSSAATIQSAPREVVESAIPPVIALLVDRSLPADVRAAKLQQTIGERMDYPALSRIMLGQAWDGLSQAQRDAFIQVFSDYIVNVYIPLMNEYNGQQVRVSEDYAAGRGGDQMVVMRVTDQKGGAERQVALIASRLRKGEEGWKVIDLTIEGISIGRVFGAQFRPVLARDGMDGLLKQLRGKKAQSRER